MNFAFAPMEGLTSCIYRRVHAESFPGVERYFAPFLAPDGEGNVKKSAWRDLLPENNPHGLPVPQLLTNSPAAFLRLARELKLLGYEEVNLNAGCPSGTVVPKHKGAGMLLDLRSLEDFLGEVFSHCPLRVSVKTRLGLESAAEFPAVLALYRRYPLAELIVHARARSGLYRAAPDHAAFALALEGSPFPVTYNGSVNDAQSLAALRKAAPGTQSVMLGRGVIADPALFRELRGGALLEKEELLDFLSRYEAALTDSGLDPHFALGRLKELWFYTGALFDDARTLKRLRKAQTLSDYRAAVSALFAGEGFRKGSHFTG